MIGACPPTDWRSPNVIDMYNQITKRLSTRFGFPFIDTNNIVGVLWDSAEDWCHIKGAASEAETTYILDKIFS